MRAIIIAGRKEIQEHTPECRAMYPDYFAFVQRWPDHCHCCTGIGWIGLKAGYGSDPIEPDHCHCIAEGQCPRCDGVLVGRLDETIYCRDCWWDQRRLDDRQLSSDRYGRSMCVEEPRCYCPWVDAGPADALP